MDRRVRMLGALLVASLAVMTLVGTVAAARPEAVAFDSTMTIVDGYNYGDFTRVSGSTALCASGDVLDTRYVWMAASRSERAGGYNPHGAQLLVDKTFSCGGDELYVTMQISGVYVSETFNWTITGGTGVFASLSGHGTGTTDYIGGNQVVNHYTGYLVP